MKRLSRMLKHRWLDESDVRRILPATVLARLQERVAASERLHSGEIRVCVEAGLPLSYLWRQASARDRALTLFGKLRVWDTEHNNGVLIYLLLAERRIEIVADRGLNQHIPAVHWTQIAGDMSAAFKSAQFEQGMNQAVDTVSALLHRHFPLAPGASNPNELADVPIIL